MEIRKHFEFLGMKVRDKVTGLSGVVTSMGFDLYGCVQVLVNPGIGKDGKPSDSFWFDVGRLEVLSDRPVMARPNFDFGPQAQGLKGPAEKPKQMKP